VESPKELVSSSPEVIMRASQHGLSLLAKEIVARTCSEYLRSVDQRSREVLLAALVLIQRLHDAASRRRRYLNPASSWPLLSRRFPVFIVCQGHPVALEAMCSAMPVPWKPGSQVQTM
jgi:hypothetical protein